MSRVQALSRMVLAGGAVPLAVSLVCLPASAAPLDDMLRALVPGHPAVRAAESNRAAVEQDVDFFRSGYLPQVDGTIRSGGERTSNVTTRNRAGRGDSESGYVDAFANSGELSVRQPLFDGFETRNRVDAARHTVDSAGYEIRDTVEAVAFRGVQAYLAVLRGQELVALAETNLARHLEVQESVEIQVADGAASEADRFQTDSRVALAETRLREFEGDLVDAQANFLEVFDAPPESLIRPRSPAAALPVRLEDAMALARENNVRVRAAAARYKSAKSRIAAEEASFLPNLNLELSANREKNTDGQRELDTQYQALLVLRYSFYSGGADTASARRAKHEAQRAIHQESEQRRLLDEQVRTSFNNVEVARDRVPLLTRRVDSAERVVGAFREQFSIGQRTLLDLLDVENELFEARVALADGGYQVLSFEYRLLRDLSMLAGYFELPVRTADAGAGD